MKKLVMVCFFALFIITFVSCELTSSIDVKINNFLEDIDSKRYIEMNVLIVVEYTDDSEETSENTALWPDTTTEYLFSIDTKDLYFSRVYSDNPDYMLGSNNTVIKEVGEEVIMYTVSENGEVLSENALNTSSLSDSEIVAGIVNDSIHDFSIKEDMEPSYYATESIGYTLTYIEMETNYLSIVSEMYSSMSLGFPEESIYTLSYIYTKDLLTISVRATYTDEESKVSQNFIITYELSFPNSIERIELN